VPARKRSPEPLPGVKHGPSGYAKGCGCPTCSESNRLGQERKRLRDKGEPTGPMKDLPAGTYGDRETKVRKVIAGYGELSDEAEVVASLAIMNARLIDRIQLDGKWHLQSVTIKSLRDCMKELKTLVNIPAPAPKSGEGGPDDFAATLRQPGEP
jgi:hypothetical protein